MNRKIVKIDQAKCNGCGLCIGACHEGAIELVDGKARLVGDIYCDGLGDCLGECPVGAIEIIEREAPAYDEQAVQERLGQLQKQPAVAASRKKTGGGCPGLKVLDFGNSEADDAYDRDLAGDRSEPSALRQWPIQLALVPVNAPYWDDADILLAADCVAYAMGNFAGRLLRGRRLAVACPKLDQRNDAYTEKLAAILQTNRIRSVTVAYMEVPCCHSLRKIAEQAVAASGKPLTIHNLQVAINGDMVEK